MTIQSKNSAECTDLMLWGQSGIGTRYGYFSLPASMVLIKVFCFGSDRSQWTKVMAEVLCILCFLSDIAQANKL